jgi:hypothetical protein
MQQQQHMSPLDQQLLQLKQQRQWQQYQQQQWQQRQLQKQQQEQPGLRKDKEEVKCTGNNNKKKNKLKISFVCLGNPALSYR